MYVSMSLFKMNVSEENVDLMIWAWIIWVCLDGEFEFKAWLKSVANGVDLM